MNETHNEMVSEWMKDSAFREEYDKLEAEFQLLDDILAARSTAGAQKIGKTANSVRTPNIPGKSARKTREQ